MRCAAALLFAAAASAADLRRLHQPSMVPEGWTATAAAVDRSAPVRVQVGIKRENLRQLDEVTRRVSTPGSPDFLRHLTWAEAGAMLAPPQERVELVLEWLRRGGATELEVHPHRDSVTATLTVADLEGMTGGSFAQYQHADSGRSIDRLTSGVWVPAEIAAAVDTFTGFHGFPLPPKRATTTPVAAAAGAVTPAVLNKVYNIPAVKKSGKANVQAIAQFQGQYVKASDLSTFCSEYEPSNRSCAIAKYIGSNGGTAGVESMLDTEYIMGLGQGTETWVYSYPSFDFCNDLLSWGADVTKNSTFPYSISVSYGSQKIDFCESSVITRLSQDIQKMGTMGITVSISSGDDGSGHSTRQGTNSGKVSPSFPASIPYAVAVGSTYYASGSSGEQEATTQFGSGGGFSYDFTAPDYQKSVVASYLAKTAKPKEGVTYATSGRGSPDVAVLGEQFTTIVNGRAEAVGGTSASSPSFAAMVSLLNEVCLAAGGRTLGFAHPLLYKNAAAFTDITKGTSAIGGNSGVGVWSAEQGWDACTGLGTPDFAKLQKVVEDACKSAAA